ncbi:Swt21p KNAG_0F01210 [Huiozyma naganishii CBS 8797]|uniref:Protein SWT21 n=1 Tax=Huiozyma naganishii (strain ATCC MYA-139 / BCRC 22969 / CBS 8797 / KCTC 17520 / NBRC 10181 / NCYC 3082 / Yp74L-3) TaxID=1071383 RepID=J7S759_HUIN7|nr:hypothetical protein KNAG_0F01210 [Kazachstania naganishii CBS 8797]CCK70789.1 hypothetical protein KNAG_0F01210 [Kazachstania naganishii CBS 8797]
MPSIKVVFSTNDTFDGRDLSRIWQRENAKHKALVLTQPDYQFPKLQYSSYADDKLEKPVVIQDLKWSNDGTSIVSVSNDSGVRQYLVPEATSDCTPELVPFTRVFKNRSIVSSCISPRYSLYNENTSGNFVLLGSRDIPIQLYGLSAGSEEQVNFSYSTLDQLNENYNVPYSLHIFPRAADDRFYMGSTRNRVSVYDMNRDKPLLELQSTRRQCGKSASHKSIVSCFNDTKVNNMVVFGNYHNELHGLDERCCELTQLAKSHGGNGIYQVLTSENGHYCYVLKRHSSEISVLDVRQSFQRVNSLKLPETTRNQKLYATNCPDKGILMGTPRGTICCWDRLVVEFGGIDVKATSPEENLPHCTPTEYTFLQEDTNNTNITEASRIGIAATNASDPLSMAFSYNADKFKTTTATESDTKSGFVITEFGNER